MNDKIGTVGSSLIEWGREGEYTKVPTPESKQRAGYAPLETLPAEWYNTYLQTLDIHINDLQTLILSLYDEIKNVLAANGEEPNELRQNQLQESIETQITDSHVIATGSQKGEVVSSAGIKNVSVDPNTGVMLVNALRDWEGEQTVQEKWETLTDDYEEWKSEHDAEWIKEIAEWRATADENAKEWRENADANEKAWREGADQTLQEVEQIADEQVGRVTSAIDEMEGTIKERAHITAVNVEQREDGLHIVSRVDGSDEPLHTETGDFLSLVLSNPSDTQTSSYPLFMDAFDPSYKNLVPLPSADIKTSQSFSGTKQTAWNVLSDGTIFYGCDVTNSTVLLTASSPDGGAVVGMQSADVSSLLPDGISRVDCSAMSDTAVIAVVSPKGDEDDTRVVLVSQDRGQTWEKFPLFTPDTTLQGDDTYHGQDFTAVYLSYVNGAWYMGYMMFDVHANDTTYTKYDVVQGYKTSRDGGRTWEDHVTKIDSWLDFINHGDLEGDEKYDGTSAQQHCPYMFFSDSSYLYRADIHMDDVLDSESQSEVQKLQLQYFRSDNNGSTWEAVSVMPETPVLMPLYKLPVYYKGAWYAAMQDEEDYTKILRSDDHLQTWTVAHNARGGLGGAVDFAVTDNLLLTYTDGNWVYTVDGSTWLESPCPYQPESNIAIAHNRLATASYTTLKYADMVTELHARFTYSQTDPTLKLGKTSLWLITSPTSMKPLAGVEGLSAEYKGAGSGGGSLKWRGRANSVIGVAGEDWPAWKITVSRAPKKGDAIYITTSPQQSSSKAQDVMAWGWALLIYDGTSWGGINMGFGTSPGMNGTWHIRYGSWNSAGTQMVPDDTKKTISVFCADNGNQNATKICFRGANISIWIAYDTDPFTVSAPEKQAMNGGVLPAQYNSAPALIPSVGYSQGMSSVQAARYAGSVSLNGVNTAAIQDKAVTGAKIADKTVTATQLADSTITTAKFASDAKVPRATGLYDGSNNLGVNVGGAGGECLEVRRIIDFHYPAVTSQDYTARIDAGTSTTARTLTLPTTSGTLVASSWNSSTRVLNLYV